MTWSVWLSRSYLRIEERGLEAGGRNEHPPTPALLPGLPQAGCALRASRRPAAEARVETSGRTCPGDGVPWPVVPIADEEFQSLLDQVRDLHRLADAVTREKTRIDENVRARLSWDRNPPVLPSEQRKLADEVVEVLAKPRLSSSQSRQLQRVFFGK